ncbi:MAG TPA: hypothetical protein VFR69_05430 [Rubrobacteraceae bacterium]|jgi:hypothetical protein|nr:hypothetical protein [Rubrobacteraceae bacterium]
MYQMNEIDLWSQRRKELEREAGHLAQSLRAARPKRASRFRRALFGWSPVRPRAASGGRA